MPRTSSTTRESLLVLDPELKVVSANSAFYETFRVSPEETEGRLIYELGDHQWDIPALAELLEKILPANSVIADFEVKHDFPTIGIKFIRVNARRIYDREGNNLQLILLAIEDITERRLAENARAMLEDQLSQVQKLESMGTLAAGIAHDMNNLLNIIQGYAFVLGRNATIDDIAHSVEAITETTKRGARWSNSF